MKKTNILILILIFTINLFAQDKTVEIKLEKGRLLSGVYNSKNGIQFIKTSNKSKYGKKQKAKLIRFDENLEKSFEINIKGRNKMGAAFVRATTFFDTEEASNYGNYFLNNDQLIDKEGKIHHFEVDYRKQNHVNPIFSFFSDYGWSFIGPRKGRKYYKKKYTNDDINIYTIKNSDSKTILEKLKTPKIETNRETITWLMGENFPTKFFMRAKDKPNKKMNNITHHMVAYDYEGNVKSYTPLKITLKNNYFAYGSEIVHYSLIKDSFYVLGALSTKIERENAQKYNVTGFYIHKFDIKGKLIWENNYLLNKPVKKYIGEINLNLKEINNNFIVDFSFGINGKKDSKTGGFFYINSENGTFIKSENPFKNYIIKRLMFSTSSSYEEKNNMGGKFFKNKSNKKINVSNNVLLSYVYNPKIQKYIESKNKQLFYNASFTKGSIILKEFNQKERILKLMLFKN